MFVVFIYTLQLLIEPNLRILLCFLRYTFFFDIKCLTLRFDTQQNDVAIATNPVPLGINFCHLPENKNSCIEDY